MSNPPPEVLQMARQGHPEAIATLINRHLEANGIIAYVAQQDDLLQVILESVAAPNQADLVPYVTRGIKGLDLAHIHRLTISGKQQGNYASDWTEEITLGTGMAIAPPLGEPGVGTNPTELDELDQLLASQEVSGTPTPDVAEDELDLERELGLVFDDQGDLDLADLPSLDLDQAFDFDLDLPKTADQTDDLGFDSNLETASSLEAADFSDLNLDFLVDQDSLNFDSELSPDFDLTTPATAPQAYSAISQTDQEITDIWDSSFDLSPSSWTTGAENQTPLDLEEPSPVAGEEFDPNLIFASAVEEPPAQPFAIPSGAEAPSGITWPEDEWDSPDHLSAALPQPSAADLGWSLDSTDGMVSQQLEPETLNLEVEAFSVGSQPPLPDQIPASAADIAAPEIDLGDRPASIPEDDFNLRDLSLPDLDTPDLDLGGSGSVGFEPIADLDIPDLDLGGPGPVGFEPIADLDIPDLDLGGPGPVGFDQVEVDDLSPVDFNQDFYNPNLSLGKEQRNGFFPELEESTPTSDAADLDAADDFIHKFAPVSDEDVAQLNSRPTANFRALPKILAGVGFGALALVLSWMGFNTFRTVVEQRPETTMAPVPTVPPKPDQGTELAKADAFRQAVNAATKAANLSQTAKTAADWEVIVNSWKQAIALMQQVSSDHPKYSIAQTKIGQYQSNLAYAQQNLSRLSQPR
ncbi:MAG: hypothetical protein ACOYMP_01935 [Nodosilinea sp.]